MRWISAVLLCGFLAMVMAFASLSPPALAMQVESNLPSDAARAFCPEEEDLERAAPVTMAPEQEQSGSVAVREITNPYFPASSSGTLVMTFVTLPPNTCILRSYFYPSMVMTVASGDISILVEHWPGVADYPKAYIDPSVIEPLQTLTPGVSTPIAAGAWITIENESFVGFRNDAGVEATIYVAGIKMARDPGGGGGHTGRRP